MHDLMKETESCSAVNSVKIMKSLRYCEVPRLAMLVFDSRDTCMLFILSQEC